MKHGFTLFLFLVCGFVGHGQANDTLNIYQISLTHHLEYLKSLNKNVQSVFVEKSDLTSELPEKIGDVRVVYLTRSEIQAKTKKGNRIDLIVIRPVMINAKSIKTVIIDFAVTSKKNKFKYANGGGSTFEFKYNCDLESFELASKKQTGI